MGYERYPRDSNLGGYYGRPEDPEAGRDYGSGRDYSYSSARDYAAAGYDLGRRAPRDEWRGEYETGTGRPWRGSYMHDGRPETDYGANRRRERDHDRAHDRPDDRGFMARAGDEVRSWFGDEDAERRREADARDNARRDADYHSWRRNQLASFDRDYDEYRRENASRFEREFGAWRNERQQQRGCLARVTEHMEVVGSDGAQVGTVDCVRGDRIILSKGDPEAGGRHHSIPSRWIASVDDKVAIRKTADEAHAHWRDEERNQALFGAEEEERDTGGHMLNRSFSGTY